MSFLFAAEGVLQSVPEIPSPFLPDPWAGMVLALIYGPLGIVLLLVGYWLFDRITPRIDFQKELNEKNMALGLVIAALLLGIAYITGIAIK
jgi:putative membrane protein